MYKSVMAIMTLLLTLLTNLAGVEPKVEMRDFNVECYCAFDTCKCYG